MQLTKLFLAALFVLGITTQTTENLKIEESDDFNKELEDLLVKVGDVAPSVDTVFEIEDADTSVV
jgi:hypothetical protein